MGGLLLFYLHCWILFGPTVNLGVTRSTAGTKEKEIRNQFYVSWPMGFEIVGSKTTW
jgi:hypothetical protein